MNEQKKDRAKKRIICNLIELRKKNTLLCSQRFLACLSVRLSVKMDLSTHFGGFKICLKNLLTLKKAPIK